MLTWFFPKKNILYTTLLEGMTDIHTHLLPGVDDGVGYLMDSVAALKRMQEIGLNRIFLTSHMMTESFNNTPDSLAIKYAILKECCPTGLELYLAAEYMLDAGFADRVKEGLLTLPGKRVLVETSYLSAPDNFHTILFELSLEGYIPIIGHPERYMYLEEEDYSLLKDKGYQLQLNLFSLSGAYGMRPLSVSRMLLKKGLYDYVGSDFHNLENYEKGLRRLNLTSEQIVQLRRLFDNNRAL